MMAINMMAKWIAICICLFFLPGIFTHNDECLHSFGCECHKHAHELDLNCSGRNLSSIPYNLSTSIVYLDLSYNNITHIKWGSLLNMKKLLYLDISFNGLKTIDKNAFVDLLSLETLYLRNNALNITDQSKDISPKVFQSLKRLKRLDIRNNTLGINNNYYPSDMWRYLVNLEEVMLDGLLHTNLSEGFAYLQSLKLLSFDSGNCQITSIKAATFEVLKDIPLETLDISNCFIIELAPEMFTNIRHLKTLKLVGNPIRENIFTVAHGVHNTRIENLYLNNTGIGTQASKFVGLLKGASIKTLTLDTNSIYNIDIDLSETLPHLQHLSLADNYIYGKIEFTLDMLALQELISLNICCMFSYHSSNINAPFKGSTQGFFVHFCELGTACPIPLPPQLELLELSDFGLHLPSIPEIVVMTKNKLKYLYIRNSRLQSFTKPLYCLHGIFIEVLDLSENSMSAFDKTGFNTCDWSALTELRLGGNSLRAEFHKPMNETLIAYLPNLQKLNLTDNRINSLKWDTFHANPNLTHLYLASNNLANVNFDISHMLNLRVLDLSNNYLPCLNNVTTKMIDDMVTHITTVNLDGNLLKCSCECSHFYEWLRKRRGLFPNINSYNCTFGDGSIVSLDRLGDITSRLSGECQSMLWLYLPLALVIFALVVESLVFWGYRFRYDILYAYYRIRYSGKKIRLKKARFIYDAFIAYNVRDYTWVRNELYKTLEEEDKLFQFCFHHKDFLPGATIVDNILDAIDTSRYTILVVSNASLQSEWWQFEVNMAHQVSLQRHRDMIICVFLETIDNALLPTGIARMLNIFTCIRWGNNKHSQVIFWKKLKAALVRDKHI